MMVNQLKWFCKMIAICNDNFGVVPVHGNYHPLPVPDWIDFFSVNNDPDI
jgi:hypothetical protein